MVRQASIESMKKQDENIPDEAIAERANSTDNSRPTALELYLFRIDSPKLSLKRKHFIAKFVQQYPHNNTTINRYKQNVETAWKSKVATFD